jgi:hypothetical protein
MLNGRWETVCPTAFVDNRIDPQYRFLCTEWWVPYGRGWPFRVEFNEFPCGSQNQFINTVYRAKIGYEARPEWYVCVCVCVVCGVWCVCGVCVVCVCVCVCVFQRRVRR